MVRYNRDCVRYNRDFLLIKDWKPNQRFIFVCYKREFAITEFVITKFDCSTKFLNDEFLVNLPPQIFFWTNCWFHFETLNSTHKPFRRFFAFILPDSDNYFLFFNVKKCIKSTWKLSLKKPIEKNALKIFI